MRRCHRAPRIEIFSGKRVLVPDVRSERHDADWAAVDKSHARVGAAVDSAFMALWAAEEAFEIEVVARECRVVAADEEAIYEREHHFGHLDPNRVIAGREGRGECDEQPLAIFARAVFWVESGVDFSQDFHVNCDFIERVADELDAPVYAPREGAKSLFAAPFLPPVVAVALSMDSRSSPSPFAMRKPGGESGPPWSSLRTPRTAAQ